MSQLLYTSLLLIITLRFTCGGRKICSTIRKSKYYEHDCTLACHPSKHATLIHQNYASDFEVLLENANEKQVHQKCVELLMIEFYKYLNGLSPDIMNDIFKLKEKTCNLGDFHIYLRTKKFGLDSIAYGASQLWKDVPEEIRNSTSLLLFKEKIKKAPLISCSYNCCRKYIHYVGFI